MPGLLRARRGLRPLRRAHERAASRTATTSSSTARRSGRRSRTSPTGASSSPAATRTASGTPGLTYLLVDMHAPGVEVRPLRQITGEAEFNEIFFTDVEVPVENVVGEIGGGWQVAMTTLLHERGTLGFALTAGLESQIRKLIALAKERGATAVQRDAIAREWIGLQAVRYTNYRSLTTLMKTGIPGPGGLRREALVVGGEPARDEARARAARPRGAAARRRRAVAGYWQHQQLRSRGNTIEAGTSEILRNIIAERVLGLPRSRLMEFAFTPGAGGAAARGARVPRGEPGRAARGAARARLARRLGPRGARRRRALVRRRGGPLRGGRPRALPGPVPDDRGRPARALPEVDDERAGRSSSTGSCRTSTRSTGCCART